MKLRNLRLESSPKLMIIPMIDIIFFLLVFFMMSTLYMAEQRTVPVNLPQASGTVDTARKITVTITADGLLLVDQEKIDPDFLAARVKAELNRNPEAAFMLRADRQLQYGRVVAVLDELKRLGVHKVAVATQSL